MKLVVNKCFGGFSLSEEALDRLAKIKGHPCSDVDFFWGDRSDPDLVQVVEELGDAANGADAKLRIVDIPDNIEYDIAEYDGIETIHEKHRTW